MQKRLYDLAFSVGATCRCSMSLREGGLQYQSFPYDWTGGPTVNQKVELLCRDFDGWLVRENIVRYGEFNHSCCWRDKVLGFFYIHEFTDKKPFNEQFPVVRDRMFRRARRLTKLLATSKRVLVVFLETPEFGRESVGALAEARTKLQARWPGVTFDMLFLQHEDGLRRRHYKESERDGVRSVRFDYRDRCQAKDEWMADHVEVGKWLASQYAVADYRSSAERKQWAARRRQATLARFAASGWVDYLITKYRYKLYVHLRKRMEKKGLV